MALTDIQKRNIFKALASKSLVNVGKEFQLKYDSDQKIRNAVNKVYMEVKESPEKFGIGQEVLDLVEQGMKDRKVSGKSPVVIQAESSLGELQHKELVLGARKKAWVLLNKKLDQMMTSKKPFNDESTKSLAWIAGIVFDKAQIAQGEATEHIKMIAKVDNNITSSEALDQLMRIREAQVADEEKG